MPRIQLRLYTTPGEAQIFCNFLRKDGNLEKITATVDTGAAISLFPNQLLDIIVHRYPENEVVIIEQAGIARQAFEAKEARVTISLEDQHGNITQPFEILAWFGDTTTSLVGFEGILDRAVLHLDMPQQNGWLEIEP